MRLCALLLLLLSACGARTAPWVPEEDPCLPTAEVCNQTDDDCDGSVDEGLPLSALGDPIVVRSPGETTTGECPSCDRALRGEVIALDGGLLVLWQMQMLLARPQPNTFARRLDEDGNLLEPAQLWTERSTTQSLEAVVLPDGRRALTFCERADDADHPSLLLIDDAGGAQGEPVRLSDRRCVRDGVRAQSSGARLLSTVVDWGDYGFLALAGPDLRSVSEVGLGPVMHLGLATSPSSVLVLRRIPVPPHEGAPDYWSVQVFDETGAPRGEATPPGFEPHSTHWEAVTARADGWWRIVAGEDGLRAVSLSTTGAPLGEPRHFGVGAIARWTTAMALPDEGIAVVAELAGSDTPRSELYVLDRDGFVTSAWRSDELGERPWRSARLRLVEGRVAIVYMTDAPDEDHDEVRLRMLACEP